MSKISQLTGASTLTGPEVVAGVQSGNSRKILASQLSTFGASIDTAFLQSGTGAVARTIQNKERDIVSINDFTSATGDGTTDITAAFNNATTALASTTGPREIRFPAGIWRFASKPSAIPVGITLVGQGRRNTLLLRDYTAGSSTEGFLEWNGATVLADSGGIRGLTPYAGVGTTLGVALKVSGAADATRGGHIMFENFEISSGTGQFDYGIYADGSALNTSGSQGLRDVIVQGCSIFRCAQKSIFLKNAVGWNFSNINTFAGGVGNGDIIVDGGGTALSNSTGVTFAGIYCSGTFTAQNCDQVSVAGGRITSTTVASTATNIAIFAGFGNTPSVSSTSCAIIGGISTVNGGYTKTFLAENAGGPLWVGYFSASNPKAGLYAAGSSGNPYFGIGVEQASGTNNQTYSISSSPVAIFGNPSGGAAPFTLSVAAGGTAGNTISWKDAYKITTAGLMQMISGQFYPATDAAAAQTAAGLFAGTGAPNNANGNNGDIYFRSDGGALSTVYQRRAGTWTGIV